MAIPFDRSFEAPYGEIQRVSPMVMRLVAHNPGPFTFRGTGVYIVGANEQARDVAVVDPGPLIPEHLDALKRALAGKRVTHILDAYALRSFARRAAAEGMDWRKHLWLRPTWFGQRRRRESGGGWRSRLCSGCVRARR